MEKRGLLVYCTLINSFVTAYTKGIHISVEAYCPNKENEGSEHELPKQETYHIDVFAYEGKNIEIIGQESKHAAPEEVNPPPQVERDVQAMKRLTNLPSPIMVPL